MTEEKTDQQEETMTNETDSKVTTEDQPEERTGSTIIVIVIAIIVVLVGFGYLLYRYCKKSEGGDAKILDEKTELERQKTKDEETPVQSMNSGRGTEKAPQQLFYGDPKDTQDNNDLEEVGGGGDVDTQRGTTDQDKLKK